MIARRSLLRELVALCAVIGGLLFVWSAPAPADVSGIVAGNANGPTPGEGPLVQGASIDEESVLDVASSSATLSAQIDPNGLDTTYLFEYGTSTAYGTSLPASEAELGSGSSDLTAQVHPQDLQPTTEYHFRVRATDALGTVYGADETFTTQASGGELALLDGRQWELVSPPTKNGALIQPLSAGDTVMQAAEGGGAITYLASGPIGSGVEGDPAITQALSTRGPGGWSTQDIESPHAKPTGEDTEEVSGEIFEDRFFSADLSLAVVDPSAPPGEALLSPEATEPTIYIRDDASGAYRPLVTAANVPPNTRFGFEGPQHRALAFVDATPDLSHVILGSTEALTKNAKRVNAEYGSDVNLYEWTDGRLQLVNVLPDGEATEGFAALGKGGTQYEEVVANAVSDDGRRVIFRHDQGGEFFLYMRDMAKETTVQLGGPKALFQTASSDGSKIFFNEPSASSSTFDYTGDLMVYEANTGLQTDLTVPLNPGEEAGVQSGVMGASEDGSYVYFVATGVLAPGGVSGADNLYLLHDTSTGWDTSFIAKLSTEDERSWVAQAYKEWSLSRVSSRVSPDGRYLAFMSQERLTPYDNIDAVSGKPDEEVYLYDAATGHLACTSCDPTGARPVGLFDDPREPAESLLVDRVGAWSSIPGAGTGAHELAGSIPGWAPGTHSESGFYQPRYLSDSGRLFFNSPVALVPQDTNGVEDVYEYEPQGVGSCEASSVTFSVRSGGCVDLISSGISSEESAFFDASASGDDAFFVTAARLTSQDVDTAYDVYDAHVCSAASPCYSAPVTPPECTTADSCKPAPSPQPAIFGSPASATFSGAGNVAPVLSTPTVSSGKHKAKVKRRKRSRRRRAKRPTARRSTQARVHRNEGAKRS
jgi:WD40-like Beta Propeller Repeat